MFDIESKSGDLRDTASRFKHQSHKLERMSKLKQMQMKLNAGALVVSMILIIYYLVL